jgi:hypothetical protein
MQCGLDNNILPIFYDLFNIYNKNMNAFINMISKGYQVFMKVFYYDCKYILNKN